MMSVTEGIACVLQVLMLGFKSIAITLEAVSYLAWLTTWHNTTHVHHAPQPFLHCASETALNKPGIESMVHRHWPGCARSLISTELRPILLPLVWMASNAWALASLCLIACSLEQWSPHTTLEWSDPVRNAHLLSVTCQQRCWSLLEAQPPVNSEPAAHACALLLCNLLVNKCLLQHFQSDQNEAVLSHLFLLDRWTWRHLSSYLFIAWLFQLPTTTNWTSPPIILACPRKAIYECFQLPEHLGGLGHVCASRNVAGSVITVAHLSSFHRCSIITWNCMKKKTRNTSQIPKQHIFHYDCAWKRTSVLMSFINKRWWSTMVRQTFSSVAPFFAGQVYAL